MKTGTLEITFLHYWHCGSGQAGEGDLDLVPVTEPCGLPFVPGRTLRGRLKQAGREAGVDLTALFGVGDAELEDHGRLKISHATMHNSFAEKCRRSCDNDKRREPEIAALFEDIASTAMENGVARQKSLRRVRYAVPVTLTADWTLDGNGLPETERRQLDESFLSCAAALRAIGKGKRDGFGWCKPPKIIPGEQPKPRSGTSLQASSAYDLEIELLDDVVFSATSATTGGHRTLDYVPGSALLGAAARELFASLPETDAALALAEGQVSFGNGYPILKTGQPTTPIPLAWHHAKGANPKQGEQIAPGLVHCFASTGYTDSELGRKRIQPVPMREGYLSAGGFFASLQMRQSLKTAVSEKPEEYEIAAEGDLFGYEAIAQGTRFRARLEIHTGDAARQQSLHGVLASAFDETIVRFGRSKGTEYGRAKCRLTPVAGPAAVSVVELETNLVRLLAESDLALVDPHGFPTLLPSASMFGLDQIWKLDCERCFLRIRRYSLWNAKRCGPDLERQVITKGSVIVFTREAGSQRVSVKTRVGVGHEQGLGRVQVEPEFLAKDKPAFPKTESKSGGNENESSAHAAPSDFSDPFGKWLSQRHEEKRLDVTASEHARKWVQIWKRTGSGILRKPSQWGRMDAEARNATTIASLKSRLGDPKTDGDTIFGHGRMRKEWTEKGNLAQRIWEGLTAAETECQGKDRLILAAFREAVHQMAAEARQKKEGSR